MKVKPHPLPEGALLHVYRSKGHYTDCFSTELAGRYSHPQFVERFYTTALFKAERFILKWVISRPSSDADAARLAAGEQDTFAAWCVEKRAPNQLLLSDYRGATKSWLMVESTGSENEPQTRLFFGSAVLAKETKSDGTRQIGLTYRLALGLHRRYSVALLSAAARRLKRTVG